MTEWRRNIEKKVKTPKPKRKKKKKQRANNNIFCDCVKRL